MDVRLVMRAPVGLYRAGLGFLLGKRMLLLEHIGRRTGARHNTVLEVVARPAPGRFLVASGHGVRADWFRNITAHTSVRVSVGTRRLVPATATVLPTDQATQVLRDYAEDHALAWRALRPVLARLAPDVGGTPEQLAQRIPIVELTLLDPPD